VQHAHNHDDRPLADEVEKSNTQLQPGRDPKDSVLFKWLILIEFVGLMVALGWSFLRIAAERG